MAWELKYIGFLTFEFVYPFSKNICWFFYSAMINSPGRTDVGVYYST